jgi:hypothetical protein
MIPTAFVGMGLDLMPTTPEFQRSRMTMMTPSANDADVVDRLGARY